MLGTDTSYRASSQDIVTDVTDVVGTLHKLEDKYAPLKINLLASITANVICTALRASALGNQSSSILLS